tara:strand:- start:20005 stop:20115 length:111 start_codon:yes stop_codon:yes gene_type:complete
MLTEEMLIFYAVAPVDYPLSTIEFIVRRNKVYLGYG